MIVTVDLDDVKSKLIVYGDLRTADTIIVIIPGNPGVPCYYNDFAYKLYELSPESTCILVSDHAGHSYYHRTLSLQEQITHKKELLYYIHRLNSTGNIVLMGHSIGAYMCLDLLSLPDNNLRSRIVSVVYLMPTLQFIGDTPNGVVFRLFERISVPVLPVFAEMISLTMPSKLLQWTAVNVFRQAASGVDATVNSLLHYYIVKNSLSLAKTEMRLVKHLNRDALEATKDDIHHVFLYSTNDGWVPSSHHEEMKHIVDPLNIDVLDVPHAFVLGYSNLVAETVISKLNERKLMKPNVKHISEMSKKVSTFTHGKFLRKLTFQVSIISVLCLAWINS